jgi:amicoumacin kinase
MELVMEERIVSLFRPELITEAAHHWNATGNPVLLDQVTNFVYEFPSHAERRILRLTHSSHHTEDEIVAELDWLKFLVQHGVQASQPLLSQNGRLTERYPVADSYFVATVFEYAPGRFIDPTNPQEWNSQFFRILGRTMGRLHSVTKQYNASHLRQKRSHWYEDATLRQANDYLPAGQKQVVAELEKLLVRFSNNVPTVESYGLVHGDMNTTNFHVKDGQITLFDFDDCAYNWFINDIAVAMPLYSDMFAEEGWEEPLTEFFQQYMRGYNEENHLDEFWFEYLPDSIRLQSLINLVACYQSNVPNSQYRSFYELVLMIHQHGHPLFTFDFRSVYRSLL